MDSKFHASKASLHVGQGKGHASVQKTHGDMQQECDGLSECMSSLAKAFAEHPAAAHFSKASEHYAALGEHHGTLADHHDGFIKSHAEHATLHLGAAKQEHPSKKAAESFDPDSIRELVQKGVSDALGKILVPDRISGIARSDAPAGAFGVRAVPRPGAPDPKIDKTAVPLEFQHLLGNDGDEI